MGKPPTPLENLTTYDTPSDPVVDWGVRCAVPVFLRLDAFDVLVMGDLRSRIRDSVVGLETTEVPTGSRGLRTESEIDDFFKTSIKF